MIPGDVLLLCSDGLHGTRKNCRSGKLPRSEERICSGGAERLVALANERDGSDNVSAQLIRVKSVERVGMYRGRPYKIFADAGLRRRSACHSLSMSSLHPGDQLDHYRIESLVARSGMASIYRATD